MKKSNLIKVMMLACILPLSVAVNGNDDNVTNPTQDQMIEFTNENNNNSDGKRTLIPVTASVSNEVLTVRFVVSVADATIEVSDALTQSIISQESMAAPAGTCYNYSLTELPEGIYTVSVTNNTNGETVSGEFEKLTHYSYSQHNQQCQECVFRQK